MKGAFHATQARHRAAGSRRRPSLDGGSRCPDGNNRIEGARAERGNGVEPRRSMGGHRRELRGWERFGTFPNMYLIKQTSN